MENVTPSIWLGSTFLLYLNQSPEFNQAAKGYRELYREARKGSKICSNNWVLLMAKRTVRKSLLFGWKKDIKKKYKRLWVFIVRQKRKQELIVNSWSTWQEDYMSGWWTLSMDILLIHLFFLHGLLFVPNGIPYGFPWFIFAMEIHNVWMDTPLG